MASTLQARVAHVCHPIVFKLLLRHFTVTIRVKDHEYSGCIVPRHRHLQVLQKFNELSNVNKSRSVQIGLHVSPFNSEAHHEGAMALRTHSRSNLGLVVLSGYLSLSNILNAPRAISCCSAREKRRDDSAAKDVWTAGRGRLYCTGRSYCQA